jgi:hypothetical protein
VGDHAAGCAAGRLGEQAGAPAISVVCCTDAVKRQLWGMTAKLKPRFVVTRCNMP